MVKPKPIHQPSLLRSIDACHQNLQHLFSWQQQALLLGQITSAQNLYTAFMVLHDCHKQFEDQQLIPRFATNPGQWSGKVYSAEHQKIATLINKTKISYTNMMNDLDSLDQDLDMNLEKNRLAIIALLDQQRLLKNVCEHHEMRETEDLLPLLDQQLNDEELIQLTTLLHRDWNSVFESLQSAIKNAAKVLSLNHIDMTFKFNQA